MTDTTESTEIQEQLPTRTASDVAGGVEALLLLADEPMSETTLAQALGVPVDTVSECLAELVAFYDETGRGFELRQLGGGWRYYTREEHVELVSAFVLEGQQSKLSQASLETLAVVAYQQPISRARISAVRGVNVDGVIRTLLARGLLQESGTDEVTGAVVFATTRYFLERMGLRTLDELPDLAPHLPEVDELEAELSALALVPDAPDEPDLAQTTPPAGDLAQTTSPAGDAVQPDHGQPDHDRHPHDHSTEDDA